MWGKSVVTLQAAYSAFSASLVGGNTCPGGDLVGALVGGSGRRRQPSGAVTSLWGNHQLQLPR